METSNRTQTTNGAEMFVDSGSAILDLFSKPVGRFRAAKSQKPSVNPELEALFEKAYSQNPALTLRCMFYIRDIRGNGRGDRQIFRDFLQWLEKKDPHICKRILDFIPHFGRWDDILVFNNTEVLEEVYAILKRELEAGNALCAKWLPREKSAHKRTAIKIIAGLGWSCTKYRKTLSALTSVVERDMCARKWKTISYEKIPSLAGFRYQRAFIRNDGPRYEIFKEKVMEGKVKAKVTSMYPYDIVKQIRDPRSDKNFLNTLWESMEGFTGDDVSVISMVDVSGSMHGYRVGKDLTALDISVSMGLFLSTHNTGPFNNLMLTFSTNSKIFHLGTGNSLSEKISVLHRNNNSWGNTNIVSGFNAILEVGKKNNLPPEAMPKILVIFSDMQFDSCTDMGEKKNLTAYEKASQMYEEAGYKLPLIAFWNLGGSNGAPVMLEDCNTVLLSGFSLKTFKNVLKMSAIEEEKTVEGQAVTGISPASLMLNALMDERYNIGLEDMFT